VFWFVLVRVISWIVLSFSESPVRLALYQVSNAKGGEGIKVAASPIEGNEVA